MIRSIVLSVLFALTAIAAPAQAGEPARMAERIRPKHQFTEVGAARIEVPKDGPIANAYFRPPYSRLAERVSARLPDKKTLILDARELESDKQVVPAFLNRPTKPRTEKTVRVALEAKYVVVENTASTEAFRMEWSLPEISKERRDRLVDLAMERIPAAMSQIGGRPERMIFEPRGFVIEIDGRQVVIVDMNEVAQGAADPKERAA